MNKKTINNKAGAGTKKSAHTKTEAIVAAAL